MNASTNRSSIKTEIDENGFIHIKYPDSKNDKEIISSLGQIIQTTEIKENPQSTRLLSSSQRMDFHTDHNMAKYIAWVCKSQSSIGGGSLLIDTKKIIEHLSPKCLESLQEINVQTHQVFYGDRQSHPILVMKDSQTIVYYAQWLVNLSSDNYKHQLALDEFRTGVKTAQQIRILLSEGDLLIIDNHRILHGREGFPSGSQRWLTRYWLQ